MLRIARPPMLPPRAAPVHTFAILLAGLSGAQADWSSYGNAPGGGRFVEADEINPANVDRLAVAWTFRSGDVSDGSGGTSQTSFQATPLYFDGKVILCTPYNRLVALDPATGAEIWSFDPGVDISETAASRQTDGAPLRCRGVVGWEDEAATGLCARTVFLGTIEARIHAIDAPTGQPCLAFNGGAPIDLNSLPANGQGEVNISSPGAVVGDTVVFGTSIGDNTFAQMQQGTVRAFDARTGALVWSFEPVAAGMRGRTGAANVWAPISASPELGLVYLPTTSPSPDYYGGERVGDMPHTDAVVALSAATGDPVWSFKVVRHNLWDYDLASQPIVVSTGAGAVDRPVVVQATKQGFVYVLDAASGEPVFPMREIAAPPSSVPGETASPVQVVPELPAPVARIELDPRDGFGLTVLDAWQCRRRLGRLDYHGLFTPPSARGALHVPGYAGGVNWGGISADPNRRILVVNAMNMAAEVRVLPEADFRAAAADGGDFQSTMMRGTPYGMQRRILSGFLQVPCTPPPWGEITAIDLATGGTLWRRPHGQILRWGFETPDEWGSPGMGGTMVTTTGLIFVGASMDRRIRAYDLATGNLLWRHDLPASGMASPMSYVHEGRQYVLIAAGGHAAFGEFGDALVAFALPD